MPPTAGCSPPPGGDSCLRTNIDCDGLVGATDLVLVREAYSQSAPADAPEDLCGGPGEPDPTIPDGIIDDADLSCVRADLGHGVGGLYTDDPPAGPTDVARPDETFSLLGLTYDHATGLVFAGPATTTPAWAAGCSASVTRRGIPGPGDDGSPRGRAGVLPSTLSSPVIARLCLGKLPPEGRNAH
ncbi:MAG: hypothetical protein GY842_22165 [bacterium]|nr:hypothetical protein [bacterium]